MSEEKEVKDQELDYDADIAININALDFEWTQQASLVQKYTSVMANAIFDRDKKKDDLSIKKAELDLDIRENWVEYGLPSGRDGKPTETTVANAVTVHEEVQQMMADLNQLNYEVNIFTGIRNALEHKKAGLEHLSRLYLAGYFGEPRIPQAAREAYSEHGKEVHTESLTENTRLKRRVKNG